MPASGHFWTIYPRVHRALRPVRAPEAQPWSTTLQDPEAGTVTLNGKLRRREGDGCLVVVHGLGGTTDAPYVVDTALAAERAGLSCLRICLRGADRRGQDFYHGGLTADLAAAIASPELADYARIWVVGFSLGGHMTLRHALSPDDPRVRAVAAICPPLDLGRTATAIDTPNNRVYLYYLLRGLNEIYAAVARNGRVPTPVREVRAARSMRVWDGLTVARRFGFESADDYYAKMSVGPLLPQLQRPALIVHAERDPMIPPDTYAHTLTATSPQLTYRSVRTGGHVGFPTRVPLGLDVDLPHGSQMLDEVIGWLVAH